MAKSVNSEPQGREKSFHGRENVAIKLFPDARHDLLHEEKKVAEEARELIAEWIEASI